MCGAMGPGITGSSRGIDSTWRSGGRSSSDAFDNGSLIVESAQIDDVRVRPYVSTAVVTGQNTATARVDGSQVKTRLRYTDVLVQTTTGWQAVASHVTKIREGRRSFRETLSFRSIDEYSEPWRRTLEGWLRAPGGRSRILGRTWHRGLLFQDRKSVV